MSLLFLLLFSFQYIARDPIFVPGLGARGRCASCLVQKLASLCGQERAIRYASEGGSFSRCIK